LLDGMTATWNRRRAAALITTAMTAVLAGYLIPGGPAVAATRSPLAIPSATAGVSVTLRFGGHAAAATLINSPASRQLAAMLPLTVRLQDVWGQAKSGRLSQPLTVEGVTPVHDPTPGDIYFWPTTEVIALYYDDLGLPVPDPGLARIGVVNTGLDRLAWAGEEFTLRIELAAATGS
jgi:hypothetical protein